MEYTFFTPHPKHEQLIESPALIKTFWGCKKGFKTPRVLWHILNRFVKYYGSIHYVTRGSLTQCREHIWTEFFNDLVRAKYPEFWDSIIKSEIGFPTMRLSGWNDSRIKLTELSLQTHVTAKLGTSFPFQTILLDDNAKTLTQEVLESLKNNMWKIKVYDQVAINDFLLRNGLIEKTRYNDLELNSRYNPKIQPELKHQNDQFLYENLDEEQITGLCAPWKCKPEIWNTLNPTNTGFWYRHLILGDGITDEEKWQYDNVNFSWRDFEDYYKKHDPEYYEECVREEESQNQFFIMYKSGQPVLDPSPQDLYRNAWIQRGRENVRLKASEYGVEKITRNIFYNIDRTFKKDQFIKGLGCDPSYVGDDLAVACDLIYEPEKGRVFILGFPYLEKESSDREMEDFIKTCLSRDPDLDQKKIGVDANNNQVVYNLSKEGIRVKGFYANKLENFGFSKEMKFSGIRDQLYWLFRELLEQDKVVFILDKWDYYLEEEIQKTQTVPSDGKVELQKKKKMGLTGRNSPDRLDALAYGIGAMLSKRVTVKKGRLILGSKSKTSALRRR